MYYCCLVWSTGRHEPGLYTVIVTDRNSSISGSSFPFDLLAALPVNSSGEASAVFRDEVGGAGGVGDMGLGLLVVATVCGEHAPAAPCFASDDLHHKMAFIP